MHKSHDEGEVHQKVEPVRLSYRPEECTTELQGLYTSLVSTVRQNGPCLRRSEDDVILSILVSVPLYYTFSH